LPWAGLFCPCRAEDGQTRTDTDEHRQTRAASGRGQNLSIKYIAGNFPLPHGRGLVVCWPARRYVIHFNIRKRLRGFIALVSIPEYICRWLNMWYAQHKLRWNKHAHASVGGGSGNFMSPLQGLKKILGTLYPGRRFACPGLVYFALTGQKWIRYRGSSLRFPLSQE